MFGPFVGGMDQWLGSERMDVLDVEVAVAITGDEVVLPVDLDDETLFATEMFAKRFARSGEITRGFVEAFGRSHIAADGERQSHSLFNIQWIHGQVFRSGSKLANQHVRP